MPTLPAPSDTAWLALDRQLCFALHSTSLAMTRRYTPLLAPLGLTYPQYLVLLVLWEEDALGVAELGSRLFLDFGTLSPLLKRMAAAGWLTRQRDPADERRVRVSLTTEGRALQEPARAIPQQMFGATGCPLDELSSLTDRLQRLRSRLLAGPSTDPSPH